VSSITLAASRPTLVDRLFARSLATDLVLIGAGAVLTGVLAQVVIPLQPVPITGQTLAVILVGSTLGALRGALSMVLYLALGAVGLPWFSDASSGWGVVAGPTGGYIVGFIAAAAVTGWLAQRSWDRRVVGAFVSMSAGTLVTFAVGLPWLAASLGLTFEQTLAGGLYPFLIGGVIKAMLAAGILPLAWKLSSRKDDTEA
jgi:biotin transport system substrate-specific component